MMAVPSCGLVKPTGFFAKLPPATIDNILDRRSAQGFTIMFVSCREKLYNGAGPGKVSQPNEAWWSYLDEYVAKCAARNMYVGITLDGGELRKVTLRKTCTIMGNG
jgi:hypothetical protein